MLAVARKGVHPFVYEVTIVLLASFAIALTGLLSFRLPFSHVPITFQVSFCLFLGTFLGPRRALFAVLAFLVEGAMGMPVFSHLGSGLPWLLGPTGGYLLGYLFGSALAGVVARRIPGKRGTFYGMCAGNLLVYALGASWLVNFTGSLSAALLTGVAPFVVGDLCKNLMFTLSNWGESVEGL